MINPLKLRRPVCQMLRAGLLKITLVMYVVAIFGASLTAAPADRIIRGTVRDAESQTGLPGVNLIIKGSQQGTTTDVNGKFEIAVPGDSTVLVVSFVGYLSHSVVVGSASTLDISLKVDQKALDEVVVVGYGTQSRRNVTGSVAKVDMKQTENLPNTNITQALRGRVAGVQFTDNGRPGQNGSILVRGPRSLSGGNNPLIVLDGIFFNGSMAEINPNDIESMEVLKDASAAAIYGSRAANGVILITSKKGTTEKPTIRFNAFAGIADRAYKVKLLTPERYLERKRDYNKAVGLPFEKITDLLQSSEVANYEAGKIVDHWDVVSQDSKISSYDLSLAGRAKHTSYFISAFLVDERGLYLNDNMKRISLRANIENEVTKWLTLGVNSTYSRRDYSGREPDQASNIGPYSTPFFEDGEPTFYLLPEDQTNQGNPVRNSILTKNEEIWHNLFANFYALINVPFIKGLNYRLNYSPNYRWRHNYDFFRQDKHITANTTTASKVNQEDFDWVMENILTYSKQLNPDNAVDVTLLYGRNHLGWESTTANAVQLSSDVLGWHNLGLGAVLTNSSSAGSSDGVSSMLRINYKLMDKYLFTLTARRDGSSVFASNNKYATFPSGSVAWIASEESFLKSVGFLDLLKVRMSYGAVGNQAISPYQSLSLSATNRYVFSDGGVSSLGVFPSSMANPDLKWETTYTANAAIDFELFKRRVGGTVEFYNMDTKNLLVQRSLPTMTGYNSVWTNLGATNNKGFELTLNTINLQKGKFEWSTNFVFSTNKNKIVHLYNSDTNGDGKEDDDLGNRWFIGQPVSVAYDYVFDGIYQEGDEIPANSKAGSVRLKDLNGDGKIDPANDRKIVGQTGQPLYRWGVTNNLRYKNITLSVFVNALQGWISAIDLNPGIHTHRNYNRIDDGWWTPENKSNTSPSVVYVNPLGHNYYRSRNFVRLQDVSLVYQFPDALIKRAKLSGLQVFASGKNLYTITKWPGYDPESGASQNGIPASRIVTLGVNFGF